MWLPLYEWSLVVEGYGGDGGFTHALDVPGVLGASIGEIVMYSLTKRLLIAMAALGLWGWPAADATAAMTLTPAGIAEGLSLSTFASGFPNSGATGVGPIGIAFPNSGGVLVTDNPAGTIQLFPTDTDGQNAASVPAMSSPAFGLTKLNGVIYASSVFGPVLQLNDNGTTNQTIVTPTGEGIVANPFTGHLYLADTGATSILDINPIAKTFTTFLAGVSADGLTLSLDGSTLYAAVSGASVEGFNTTTGAVVFNAAVSGGPDGVAIGTGSLAGTILVNTNAGTVVQINLATSVQTVVASGGSRGDFVAADPNNGTLLLTQTDSILRLTAAGGGVGTPTVPEPSSIIMAATGLVAAMAYARHRRRN
jgi:hypothetical protein